MVRKYGQGEGKPELFEDRCAGGCGRKQKRGGRVFNTCGRQGCIQKVNEGLRGASVDNRDPSAGRKVQIDGKWHTVKNSGSNRNGHFVKLTDGHTVSLDNIQAWKD